MPLHAVLLPPGPQLSDLLTAALDGGPAILPLDPQGSATARDRLLQRLRPDALVDGAGVHPLPDPAPLDDDIAVVVATSGSSGRPKGVQLSAAALLHSATATLTRLAARPRQRWLCCLPTHHIAGLQVLVRSLVAASAPVIHPRFDPSALADTEADFVSLVPTMLYRALEAGVDLSRFHRILLGGASASPMLLEQAAEAGGRVTTTYGMSETCGGAVYDGVPLDGVEVGVEPADGVIRLRGPVLAHGYRLDPAATATAFVDGWYVTPDVGARSPNGGLRVLGRRDDMIITGGVNVSLQQVAAVLAARRGVAEAAAYARADPEWGQRIVAVVVPRDPAPTLTELRAFVAEAIEPAAAPRELILVEALPLLPSGKLDRQALTGLAG
ncbi:MAG: AMP-binding protein [Geodermatophilaceae bacterium]|nr:AMP-binding protein [Geodermatophilaceae bacterium]